MPLLSKHDELLRWTFFDLTDSASDTEVTDNYKN